jgi:hypothetical protein
MSGRGSSSSRPRRLAIALVAAASARTAWLRRRSRGERPAEGLAPSVGAPRPSVERVPSAERVPNAERVPSAERPDATPGSAAERWLPADWAPAVSAPMPASDSSSGEHVELQQAVRWLPDPTARPASRPQPARRPASRPQPAGSVGARRISRPVLGGAALSLGAVVVAAALVTVGGGTSAHRTRTAQRAQAPRLVLSRFGRRQAASGAVRVAIEAPAGSRPVRGAGSTHARALAGAAPAGPPESSSSVPSAASSSSPAGGSSAPTSTSSSSAASASGSSGSAASSAPAPAGSSGAPSSPAPGSGSPAQSAVSQVESTVTSAPTTVQTVVSTASNVPAPLP